MYILDSILKNVQGNYVQHIESQIVLVFQTAFANCRNDDELKALIKLFKTWQLIMDPSLLQHIANLLSIGYHVSLTKENE
jgi:hypothetical protein